MKLTTLLALVSVLLSGCAASPALRYHSLVASAAGDAEQVASSARLQILIAAVSVPESVDRPQLMLQGASGEIELIDGERWAEPLRRGIARALAAEIMAALGSATVWTAPATAPARPDVRIAIEVLRFESHPGRESVIEANWVVRGGGTERSGRSLIRTPTVSSGFTGLVQAHRDGLRALSQTLLSALHPLPLRER